MIEQRSPEWFAARMGHVTASRADAIMAEAKTKGAVTAGWRNYMAEGVAEILTGQPTPEGFVSDAMNRGTEKEPDARSWYCEKNDVLVTQLGFEKHKTIKWIGASVDSEVEEGVGGLEIKCPNTATHIDTILNGTMKYTAQVQFQMWVMGWQWVDFVSYDDRMPRELWGYQNRIKRDNEYIDKLELKTILFLKEREEMIQKLRRLM
jgi:putative phage-type endonuclease